MLVKVKKKEKKLPHVCNHMCNRCVFRLKNEIQLKMNLIFSFYFPYLQTLTIHHFQVDRNTKKAEFCNKLRQDHPFQKIFS